MTRSGWGHCIGHGFGMSMSRWCRSRTAAPDGRLTPEPRRIMQVRSRRCWHGPPDVLGTARVASPADTGYRPTRPRPLPCGLGVRSWWPGRSPDSRDIPHGQRACIRSWGRNAEQVVGAALSGGHKTDSSPGRNDAVRVSPAPTGRRRRRPSPTVSKRSHQAARLNHASAVHHNPSPGLLDGLPGNRGRVG